MRAKRVVYVEVDNHLMSWVVWASVLKNSTIYRIELWKYKPPLYFIENPQTGKMKNYISDRPYYDVDYCKYSDWGMRKRTRIWTNKIGFKPKVCNKDCGFMKDGRPRQVVIKTQRVKVAQINACAIGYHHY